jgi:perosamine synthetase
VPTDWAGAKRDALLRIMAEEYNIGSIVANPPVHTTVPFLQRHAGHWRLPRSEELAARLFCVALHPAMTDEQNQFVCAALMEAVEELRSA